MQNTCANNAQVNEQAQLGVGLYHPTLEMTAAPQAASPYRKPGQEARKAACRTRTWRTWTGCWSGV